MMEGGLGWLGWTLLGLVPPLIFLLYFLKLRRTPIEVPSTFLWSRTIEDLQVNSLWQRLRNSLLLWLQLLAALLILLACLRPGCDSSEYTAGRHIFLLDTSASMGATDVGKTRFQLAREKMEERIRELPSNSRIMLMTSNDTSQIRQSYTMDRNLVLRKLEQIEQTEHLTNFEEALIAATGLSNPSEIRDVNDTMSPEEIAEEALRNQAMLHLYSDGGFPEVEDVNLGQLLVDYVPVGEKDVDNVGIISFNGEFLNANKDEIDLFARIENFSDQGRNLEIQLYRDGELIDALQRDGVAAREIISLEFTDRVPTAGSEVVEYRLKLVEEDQFAADNTTYCVMNPGRKARVLLITSGNPNLSAALSTSLVAEGLSLEVQGPEFLETDAFQEATKTSVYELVIFDRVSPAAMPRSNTMFWGSLPSSEGWESEALEQPIFVLFSNNVHPLTSGLVLDSLAFSKANRVTGPQSSLELINANTGSLATIAPREGFQDLVLGFSLVENIDGSIMPVTDWPARLSFPIFIHNTLQFLAGLGEKEIESSIRPGQLLSFRLEDIPDNSLQIVLPDGSSQEIRKQSSGGFVFSQTDQLGLYRVRDNEDNHRLSFAVSLSDRRESDIRVRDEAIVGGSTVSDESGLEVPRASQWWRYLLIMALAVIVVEWFVYNRRILM